MIYYIENHTNVMMKLVNEQSALKDFKFFNSLQ